MPSELVSPTTTKEQITQHLSKMRIHKSGEKPQLQQQQQQQKHILNYGKVGSGGSSSSSSNGSCDSGLPSNPDEVQLPQTFEVKYLGRREARGLWGIKHTRKPVDEMVAAAR